VVIRAACMTTSAPLTCRCGPAVHDSTKSSVDHHDSRKLSEELGNLHIILIVCVCLEIRRERGAHKTFMFALSLFPPVHTFTHQ
jgi:hypothetical protein